MSTKKFEEKWRLNKNVKPVKPKVKKKKEKLDPRIKNLKKIFSIQVNDYRHKNEEEVISSHPEIFSQDQALT